MPRANSIELRAAESVTPARYDRTLAGASAKIWSRGSSVFSSFSKPSHLIRRCQMPSIEEWEMMRSIE